MDAAFVKAYQTAVEKHLERLRAHGPVILNDFLNMTLFGSNGTTDRFQMNKGAYSLMARTAHPPLALYSILEREGFGPLTEGGRAALMQYVTLLEAANTEVTGMQLDDRTRRRLGAILVRSKAFAEGALETGVASRERFRRFAMHTRPLLLANLKAGAREQLEQFMAQLKRWRQRFPTERWKNLRVVVLGFHQARDLYATKLLFQWLLREPATEKRVVYAEVLIPPFKLDKERSQTLALELLGKVDLEREAAAVILGEEAALQRDVMGPAARELLKSWGASPWP